MKWRNAVAERVDLEDQLDPEYVRRRVCARLLAPCLPVRCSWLDAVSISSIQKRISTLKPSMLIFPEANIKIRPSSQCNPGAKRPLADR
jgi:hypothetical protein